MSEFIEYERFCPLPRLEPHERKPGKWLTFMIDIALLGAIFSLAYLIHHALSSLIL